MINELSRKDVEEKFLFDVKIKELEIATDTGFDPTGLIAIYKAKNGNARNWLGYHTEEYSVITNETVVLAVEHLCKEMGVNISHYDSKTSYNNGKRMFLTMVTDTSIQLPGGDKHSLAFNIRNSYDGSVSYGLDFGAFRWICSNGAYIGMMLKNIKKKHLSEFNLEHLREQISQALTRFPELEVYLKRMQDAELFQVSLKKIFKDAVERKIIGKADAERLVEMNLGETNMYNVYNNITFYLTHMNVPFERARRLNMYVSQRLGKILDNRKKP